MQSPKLMEGGKYILEGMEAVKSTFLIFSMQEEVGALARALKIFEVRTPVMNLIITKMRNEFLGTRIVVYLALLKYIKYITSA